MARTATLIKGNTVEFKFPFNWDIIDRIKKVENKKWNAAKKTWSINLDFRNCFEAERIINEYKFQADKGTLDKIKDFKQEAKELVQVKKNGHIEVPLLEPPKVMVDRMAELGFAYRPYQIEGFSSLATWGNDMNGCEMGLGKTLQSLTAIEYKQFYPCLILCPASLKYNWFNEIAKFLPHRKAQVLDSKTLIYKGSDFYIINYDNIKKRKDDLIKQGFKGGIFDESQYLKNGKAQRSKAAMDIAKNIPVVHELSGTFAEKGPADLIHQLKIIGRIEELGGYWSFINRYCAPKSNGFGLDISGAANVEELHLRMARRFYFRRNKADVLKDLPDKIYNTIEVDITNRKEYNAAYKNIIGYYREKSKNDKELKQLTKGLSKEEKKEVIEQWQDQAQERASGAEHLVLLSTLRKISAYGQIEPAKEWVKNVLEVSNRKVLIFCWHTEVVLQLAEEFDCDSIHGGVDSKLRQQYVDKFQQDPKVRTMVLNIKAGGVGLNLTEADIVLFIEEPFNPALKLQAEDRAHRIGRKNTVDVYTMIGRDTIDMQIYAQLQEELAIINAINAGKFVEREVNKDITGLILKDLQQKALEK